MRQENREARKQAIERAAFALLREKGFAGTSMLAVARRARASNETLYNWYGDKQGLYCSLIESNARKVAAELDALLDTPDPVVALRAIGPVLLAMLVSQEAVALNRAAAGDTTGKLGADLARLGRGTIEPMMHTLFERARAAGQMAFDDTAHAVGIYLSLLTGDLQIRRVTAAMPALSPVQVAQRAEIALDATLVLFASARSA